MTNNELLDVIKLLITTLDSTVWDDCPDCSCDECYRACCEFNKSALFKKLHSELPKLYENVGGK